MFAMATAAILLTMGMALFRAFRGPSVFDRVQAVNMMGTKTVLLIAVSGFLSGRPEWLDLAILYVLINFIGMLRFDGALVVSDEGSYYILSRTSHPTAGRWMSFGMPVWYVSTSYYETKDQMRARLADKETLLKSLRKGIHGST